MKSNTSLQTCKPKERIVFRLTSETPVNQNLVSVIYELQPNAKWVCTELTTKKHSTTFEMRLLLPLANQCFVGTAKTKKLAKAEAASKALLELYNICVSTHNQQNCDLFKGKTTVQIAQEPLLLKQVSRQVIPLIGLKLFVLTNSGHRQQSGRCRSVQM